MSNRFENRDFFPSERALDRSSHLKNAELILKEGEGTRLQEIDFADVYPKAEISRDRQVIETLKAKFEKDLDHLSPEEIKRVEAGKKMSEALEAIIVEEGETFNWFGKDTLVIRTTEYDDVVNGVDAVLEFEPSENDSPDERVRRLALAIDASMSPEHFSVQRKISRHSEHLTRKRPPLEIKYFNSAADNYKGKLTRVVPVVVGIEGKNTDELIDLFAQLTKLGNAPKQNQTAMSLYKEKIQEAENHPVQVIFLREIQEQLIYYLRLLELFQDSEADFYRTEITKLLTNIEKSLETKKDINATNLEQDQVFCLIKKLTQKKVY